MYTIIDYIKYYKNFSFKEACWNEIDNLLCSILVYLPVKSYSGVKTVGNLKNYINKYPVELSGLMASKSLEILDLISNSVRYKDIKVYNFKNIKNDNTQFGAAIFRIKNNTIVSYKGTDGSIIGWIENIRIAYEYPTYSQKLAINYLNNNIILTDNNIIVLGHSKGGNMAIVAAMESKKSIIKRIKNIYNFDGPGLIADVFNNNKFKNIKNTLINIIPTGSYVGVLLNNNDYNVVKSEEVAINEHYPTSWNVFGQTFVNGNLSQVSKRLHLTTTDRIKDVNKTDLKIAFETIFKSIDKDYSSGVNMSFEELIQFYKNVKNIDPAIKKNIDKVISSLVEAISYNK